MLPPARRPRSVMPFFLVAVGIGLCAWYGQSWYALPEYTVTDIEASVEANLAVDLARMGPHLKPDEAGMERLRAQIRSELESEMQKERQDIQQGLAIGLVCLVLAAGNFVFMRHMRNPRN